MRLTARQTANEQDWLAHFLRCKFRWNHSYFRSSKLISSAYEFDSLLHVWPRICKVNCLSRSCFEKVTMKDHFNWTICCVRKYKFGRPVVNINLHSSLCVCWGLTLSPLEFIFFSHFAIFSWSAASCLTIVICVCLQQFIRTERLFCLLCTLFIHST